MLLKYIDCALRLSSWDRKVWHKELFPVFRNRKEIPTRNLHSSKVLIDAFSAYFSTRHAKSLTNNFFSTYKLSAWHLHSTTPKRKSNSISPAWQTENVTEKMHWFLLYQDHCLFTWKNDLWSKVYSSLWFQLQDTVLLFVVPCFRVWNSSLKDLVQFPIYEAYIFIGSIPNFDPIIGTFHTNSLAPIVLCNIYLIRCVF